MGLDFAERLAKDGGPFTEKELLDAGKFLMSVKKDVDAINSTLSKFNTSKQNVFDDTLEVGSRYLDDAIGLIQKRLGEMQLELAEDKKR